MIEIAYFLDLVNKILCFALKILIKTWIIKLYVFLTLIFCYFRTWILIITHLFDAIQMVRKRHLQPLGGLRRILSLYTELPEDLSFLELTGRSYGSVCISPSSELEGKTEFSLSSLFMGIQDKAQELLFRESSHQHCTLVPALGISGFQENS